MNRQRYVKFIRCEHESTEFRVNQCIKAEYEEDKGYLVDIKYTVSNGYDNIILIFEEILQ
jgi:hypothetical protein